MKRRAKKGVRRPRRKKARNPELMILGANPSPAGARALRAFERFHGHRDPKVSEIDLPPGAPQVLISLGDVREIVYEPTDPSHRSGAEYIHKFGREAKLAADPSGRNIYIVRGRGGKTRVDWSSGIRD
jgi:hypothetical protein